MSLEVGLQSLRTPYHFHFLSLLHDCSSRCELTASRSCCRACCSLLCLPAMMDIHASGTISQTEVPCLSSCSLSAKVLERRHLQQGQHLGRQVWQAGVLEVRGWSPGVLEVEGERERGDNRGTVSGETTCVHSTGQLGVISKVTNTPYSPWSRLTV